MYYSVQRTSFSVWKWRLHLDGAHSLEGCALTRSKAKRAALKAARRAARPRPPRSTERASWRSPGPQASACGEPANG